MLRDSKATLTMYYVTGADIQCLVMLYKFFNEVKRTQIHLNFEFSTRRI